MGRSRRIIKLEGNRDYKDFRIDQAEPKPDKCGVGPYVLLYQGKELLRNPRHGECRDELESLVKEKWKIDREFGELKDAFCEKWKMSEWPDSA